MRLYNGIVSSELPITVLRAAARISCFIALAALPLAACADPEDPSVAIDDVVTDGETEDAGSESVSQVTDELISDWSAQAAALEQSVPRASSGLPLWESKPGARVALFLDFDGGRYDSRDYSGIDRDGNRSSFNKDERIKILRAALDVVEGYKGFDVNVTTSESAMRKAPKWGWILITDDHRTSGEAYVGSIARSSQCSGSSCYPKGYAGSSAVFSPSPSNQRGYLLIHELGHQFGLNHSGLYKSGKFYEWSEMPEHTTGDWLGGRDEHLRDYKWIRSQTKYSTSWQDPVKIIGDVTGAGGGSCHTVPLNDSYYCSSSCRCNEGEGDCDSSSECASGLVCVQRSGTDYCERPEGYASP